jgi:hypothetical protein
MEYLNEIVLFSVIIYLGIFNWMNHRQAEKREKDYLNRIMAQKGGEEFKNYVHGATRLDPPVKSKDKTPTIKEDLSAAGRLKEKGLSVR